VVERVTGLPEAQVKHVPNIRENSKSRGT